jgi:streptogramin lyase
MRRTLVICGVTIATTLAVGSPAWAVPALGRIDPHTGRVEEFTTGLAPASTPLGIAAGPDNALWFADQGAGAIGRVDPHSGRIEEFTTGLTPGAAPHEIAAGSGGMWFTDDGATKAIGRIDPATHHIEEFTAGLPQQSLPLGIAAGPEGDMWFTDGGSAAIGRITPAGSISELHEGFYGSVAPVEIALGPDDNLWFTGGATGALGRTDPATARTELVTVGGAGFFGVVGGPGGTVWLADEGFNRAIDTLNFSAPRNVSIEQTAHSAGLAVGSLPAEMAAGPEGRAWFTDQGTQRAIGRIDPRTYKIEEFDVTATPNYIAAGPEGDMWFTAGPSTGPVVLVPSIGSLRIAPTSLRPAASGGPTSEVTTAGTGATVTYTDTAAATTMFTVQRALRGRRHGHACIRGRRRAGRRCAVYVSVGAFAHTDVTGVNSFHFTARVRGHRLRRGRYRLLAVPSNTAGSGRAVHAAFRVH